MTIVDNPQNRRRATKAAVTTMLVATGAAIAAALGAGAAHAAEPTTYVQVVYSPATGAYGEATGSASPADLYNIAMAQCQSRGGTDCRLLHTSVNSCAALAVQIGDPATFRVGDAPRRLQADFRALRAVSGSYIVMSRCSTGDEGIG